MVQPAGFLILRRGRYSEAVQRRGEQSIAKLYTSNGFRGVKVTPEVTKNAGPCAERSLKTAPRWFKPSSIRTSRLCLATSARTSS